MQARLSCFLLLLLAWGEVRASVMQKPFLYEARKGNKTLYLLGTMHRGVPLKSAPGIVMSTLKRSQSLLIEGEYTAEIQSMVNESISNKLKEPLPGLSALLTPVALRRAKALFTFACQKENGPFDCKTELFDRLHPSMIEAVFNFYKSPQGASYVPRLLTAHPELQVTFSSTLPEIREEGQLDKELVTAARAAKIPVRNLTTNEDMVGVVFMQSIEAAAGAMNVVFADNPLKAHEATQRHIAAMRQAYLAGSDLELAGLRIADYETEGIQVLRHEKLVLERPNRAWLPVIEEQLTRHDRVFVACGANHLVGAYNLIGMLEHRGYKISRLKP